MIPTYPWLGLVLFLVVCFVAAGIGGAVTTPKITVKYDPRVISPVPSNPHPRPCPVRRPS